MLLVVKMMGGGGMFETGEGGCGSGYVGWVFVYGVLFFVSFFVVLSFFQFLCFFSSFFFFNPRL